MSHSENLLQTIKTTLQDIVAPDVRELKVRIEALEERMDARFEAVDARFASVDVRFGAVDARLDEVNNRIAALETHLRDTMEANTRTILAALAQNRAENELMILRQLAPLSERVAALEGVRH